MNDYVVTETVEPDYFNHCINNMVELSINPYVSEETRNDALKAVNEIMTHSAVKQENIDENGKPSCIRVTAEEWAYEIFVQCGEKSSSRLIIDYAARLVEKLNKFLKARNENYLRIGKLYEEYLKSDETDSKGGKTKEYFCQKNGINQDVLESAVAFRNDYFKAAGLLPVDERKEIKVAKDNKCSYLFLVENGDGDKGVLEVLEADSFKTAIKELATVAEYNMDLFNKCLVGFDDEDVDGIIELFDTFCDWHIINVYEIKSFLYERK